MGVKLEVLKMELAGLNPWPWDEMRKWAAKTGPFIKHSYPDHYAEFKEKSVEPEWEVPEKNEQDPDCIVNTLKYNQQLANNTKQELYGFLEGLMYVPQNGKVSSRGGSENPAVEHIFGICNGFPAYARQVTSPYREKTPLLIENEYDVQHHFHALLRLYFEDVRDEEPVKKFAGAWARMDFLIPDAKIVVELKMVRENHNKIGDELWLDCAKYEKSPDCDTLIFYVYNPNEKLKNPVAIKKDIESTYKGRLKVHVIING